MTQSLWNYQKYKAKCNYGNSITSQAELRLGLGDKQYYEHVFFEYTAEGIGTSKMINGGITQKTKDREFGLYPYSLSFFDRFEILCTACQLIGRRGTSSIRSSLYFSIKRYAAPNSSGACTRCTLCASLPSTTAAPRREARSQKSGLG